MNEILKLLSETGNRARNEAREQLTESKPDEEVEDIWAEGLRDQGKFNCVIVGEEGIFYAEDDPDYAFLVDPLDGTSGAVLGEFPWVTTSVAVLEDIDTSGQTVTGKPVGSYIRQIYGDTEFSSWGEKAYIDGEVKMTEIGPGHELPGVVDGTEIRPREIDSFSDLESSKKGYVSCYAASESRLPVIENFQKNFHKLSDKVRISLSGGSYTGASVGWGKTLVAAEPKPTLPTEAAGEIFADSMGSETSDIFGEENNIIIARYVDGEPERTYTSLITPSKGIHGESLRAINHIALQEPYRDKFKRYKRIREEFL